MGGRSGKSPRQRDPVYTTNSPPANYDPYSSLASYDPFVGPENSYLANANIGSLYGGFGLYPFNSLCGRYAQGLNQIQGVTPWNYGNYYLGNTTMQIMPFMLKKVALYGGMQGIATFNNIGVLGSMPVMPSMPIMSCPLASSFSPSMAMPMIATASVLPVAVNPLVQGMYPLASMSPVNFMTPSSFMSALTTGPMPYRPPAYEFPGNVGMVMTIPYGTPNPWLSQPAFSSPYSYGMGSSWPCCHYTCPMSAIQSYNTAPYAMPISLPYIQKIKLPYTIPSANTYPMFEYGKTFTTYDYPLWSSEGMITDVGYNRPAVMASNESSSKVSLQNYPLKSKTSLSMNNKGDQLQSYAGRSWSSRVSGPVSNNVVGSLGVTPSKRKYGHKKSRTDDDLANLTQHQRLSTPSISSSSYDLVRSEYRSEPVLPPIPNGVLISDSGWLPKSSSTTARTLLSLFSTKRRKRQSSTKKKGKVVVSSTGNDLLLTTRQQQRRGGRKLSPSVSEYDCELCRRHREKARLSKYYGTSVISSLFSSPSLSNSNHMDANESASFSRKDTPKSSKNAAHKSQRGHRKHTTKSVKKSWLKQSISPVLLRQIPIRKYQMQDDMEEQSIQKTSSVDDDDRHTENVSSEDLEQ